MQLGIVGKPNVGKSTFFNAATKAHAEIANYPFTTIDPNRGVMFIRKPCPCQSYQVTCTPRNSSCTNGVRFIPIEAIDVAGLVPDAHKGKGLGNKFLDDLRQAHAFIHIVDASGSTDAEGNPCDIGTHDPLEDVRFLEKEINYWMVGIIKKSWEDIAKQCVLEESKIERMLAEKLTGLGIKEEHIKNAMRKVNLELKLPTQWSDDEIFELADYVRIISKPMIIAFNKCDQAPENLMKKMREVIDYIVVPTSAASELALTNAAEKGIIEYTAGSGSFTIKEQQALSQRQQQALQYIQKHVLERYGATGVQRCIEEAVKMLRLIVVYPVEDSHHLTDKEGRVLPDAHLVPIGTTAKDLAYRVHTDLGDHFIRAIDARTHRVIGADHILNDGDVVSIVADA